MLANVKFESLDVGKLTSSLEKNGEKDFCKILTPLCCTSNLPGFKFKTKF